jgi:hypothetical protein
MDDKNNKNFLRRAVVFGAIVFVIATGFVIVGPYAGDNGNFLQRSGAMITNAWNGLFGGGLYDVNPNEYDVSTSDDATFLPTSTATSSFDDNVTPAAPKKSLSKTSASSTKIKIPDRSASSDVALYLNVATNTGDVILTSTTRASTTIAMQPSCTFPSATTSSSRKIILNEIAWMGSSPYAGESATAAANDEWIELKNNSGADINLNGWEVMSVSGAIKIIFSAADVISANRFLVLARGTASAIAQIARANYSGGLSNTGEELAVLDPQCAVSDFLNANAGWSDGNNTTKQTLERMRDDSGWQTSVPIGGTPGAENSLGVQPTVSVPTSTVSTGTAATTSTSSVATTSTNSSAPTSTNPGGVSTSGGVQQNSQNNAANSSFTNSTGESGSSAASTSASSTISQNGVFCPADHIVIAQIQIAGTSAANDFIKLYNPTAAVIDISGWKLRKKTSGGTDASLKVLPSGSAIGPGVYFTWANSANGFATSVGADVSSSETLAADNSIALMNASGTIVDEVAWGTGMSQYMEGNVFPTNPAANQILERIFVNGAIGDSDDNASDFTIH